MEYQTLKIHHYLLILLIFIPIVLCICPSKCKCSGNNRSVDCSGRNLTTLPHELQDNITHLNLSFNHLVDLDHQLTRFPNLRTLDISNNWLKNIPAHLPKSLWEIYAMGNNIKVLQKLDTAYQWNLKVLDISRNMVERAVLINNTLSSLKFLNLSSNKLWTVPTNMPSNIETVDLSNNFLTQILPGTLVRLPHLTNIYLHNNKFTYIPDKAFDQLFHLQVITLDNNPWLCNDKKNILYLLKWIKETAAIVIGSPCSNQTMSWTNTTPVLTASTITDAKLMGKGIKAADTNGSPMATEPIQVTKIQFRSNEVTLSATLSQTVVFTSTDRPLLLYPVDPTTRKTSHEAAATHSVYIKDSTDVNSSMMSSTGSSTTPMTLSITSRMLTNYSKMPQQSTTITSRKEESTTDIFNTHAPKSSICELYSSYVVMLNTVAILIGYRLAFF